MADSPVSKKRLEDLERRVKELEAKPSQETHFHYHYPYQQYWYPYGYLQPGIPWYSGTWCGTANMGLAQMGTTSGTATSGNLQVIN